MHPFSRICKTKWVFQSCVDPFTTLDRMTGTIRLLPKSHHKTTTRPTLKAAGFVLGLPTCLLSHHFGSAEIAVTPCRCCAFLFFFNFSADWPTGVGSDTMLDPIKKCSKTISLRGQWGKPIFSRSFGFQGPTCCGKLWELHWWLTVCLEPEQLGKCFQFTDSKKSLSDPVFQSSTKDDPNGHHFAPHVSPSWAGGLALVHRRSRASGKTTRAPLQAHQFGARGGQPTVWTSEGEKMPCFGLKLSRNHGLNQKQIGASWKITVIYPTVGF